MAENSATPISFTTFSYASMHRYASNDVDEILSRLPRRQLAGSAAQHSHHEENLKQFGMPAALAELVNPVGALELNTSSDRYLSRTFFSSRREQSRKSLAVERPIS